MSNYERNPGTVTLFQTSKADLEEKPKRPVMTGELKTPNGETFDISLWWATDKDSGQRKLDKKNNNHYFSGNIQVPQPSNKGGDNNGFNDTNQKAQEISSWEIN